MHTDPCFLTLAEAARLIEQRSLSPTEYARALIARIETLDPQLFAFITPTFEQAIDHARRAEADIARGQYRGPLHGMPYGLKDIYETAGIRTTAHSKVLADYVPVRDAATVTRMREAGAVLLGKLATHEFAHGGPSWDLPWPLPRNPWNRAHFASGSSSGSGVGVAAGFMPAALGTDTGASIRGPASLCGIAGLKPTFGRVSRRGVLPNSYSFDHCGPMAWTVEDCAILLSVLAGHDPHDPSSADVPVDDYRAALTGDVRGLRIGVVRHFWEEPPGAHPEAVAAMERAIDVFRELGAQTADVRLRPLAVYQDVKIAIGEAEIFAIHLPVLRARPQDFGTDFLQRTLAGAVFSAADYVHASRERRRIVAETRALHERFDLLLTIGAGPAPRLDAYRNLDFFRKPNVNTTFNVTGGPALVLRSGFTRDGLPLSLQLSGRPFDEATVLRAGDAFERATGLGTRRPVLTPGEAAPVIVPAADQDDATLDASQRDHVHRALASAGLALSDEHMALALRSAPYALAMARRLARDHRYPEETSSIFTLVG